MKIWLFYSGGDNSLNHLIFSIKNEKTTEDKIIDFDIISFLNKSEYSVTNCLPIMTNTYNENGNYYSFGGWINLTLEDYIEITK